MAKLPVPVSVNLPQKLTALDKDNLQPLLEYLSAFANSMQRELTRRSPDQTPTNGTLITSPRGNIYKVTVGDTGSVTSVLIYSPP